jgi:hypothetical protein
MWNIERYRFAKIGIIAHLVAQRSPQPCHAERTQE